MATLIGNTTAYTNSSVGTANIGAQRFQALASGTIYRLLVYTNATGSTLVGVAVYSDNAGSISTLLKKQASAIAPSGTGWLTIPLESGLDIVSGNYYWLAAWGNGTTTYYAGGDAGNISLGNGSWPTWPNTWSSAGSSGGSPFDIYADDWTPAVTYTKTFTGDGVVQVRNNLTTLTAHGFIVPTTKIYTKEAKLDLPTDNDNNLATFLTDSEYDDVGTANDVWVGEAGTYQNIIHLFKYKADNSTSPITVTWQGKSSIAPSERTVYLQIFNRTTSLWETLGSNNSANADTDFTIEGSQPDDLSDYYDAGNWISARVYQEVK